MEGLTFFFLPSTEQWGDKVMQYMNSLKQVYTVKTTDTYALLFRESIDLILNAIEAGHYDSSSIQQYLRSFSAENPIH
ncbi:MAG: hypothetical protein LBG59_03520 [Candidatus Peribacteria bacterium]|jgi:hypothetical protein|nr:hypothetical protein [Candidatus Peribacteria bacterium]